jgi:enolase-phosphatase E1
LIELQGVRAVVTDIEGTTSSIAFVHEVLFPYARARLDAFVAAHPFKAGSLVAEAGGLAALHRWMDEDRKATPLKTLQGMIWREGYLAGELKGHVYPDAAAGLRRWHAQGLKLAVYSSGSEEAQKLIFGHSEAGDLAPLFQHFFDTRIGAKAEPASYAKIAEALALPPAEILFLSDMPPEITAARAAGLQAVRLVRDGTPAADDAASFDDLTIA